MSAQFQKTIIPGFGAERIAAERRLQESGILMAVTDRLELMRSLGHSDAALVIVGDATGTALRAANIAASTARALPGHRRLHVSRFGASDNPDADDTLLRWIAEFARADHWCLALTIELFDRDAARRSRLAATLTALGFEKVKRQRNYHTTLALDLTPPADELLRALDGDTRRSIRAPIKHDMELRPVADAAFANRLADLIAQTFARTHGDTPQLPWENIIAVSQREPELSRITGVFRPNVTGPESLLSFAWGIRRGEDTRYEAGATLRRTDLGSMSLGYAPLWDLVLWAKRSGSKWFDFGGVTPGLRATPDDPLGGISAFKRSFCDNVVDVGEEWVLHPHPVRSTIADIVATAAHIGQPRKRGAG